LEDYLQQHGFLVTCSESADAAIRVMGISSDRDEEGGGFQFDSKDPRANDDMADIGFDVVLTDIRMPGMDGLEFTRLLQRRFPRLPVIVMTAYGSMDTAIQALRSGAFDFVTKPVELELLRASLNRASENSLLRRQVRLLESESAAKQFSELLGQSDAILRLKEQLSHVVNSTASVLLSGESGTGKEVVARALHSRSERAGKPFIAVNCAALPESLLESELFGHVKGAFTDAREDRKGLFLQADGGTLFLDEIGEMPLEMQPKLLRSIEQKTVRPVGGRQEFPFDVRLVSATNRDLQEEIEARRFREDLFYRINVLEINIPPLRTRGMDVLLLANHFLIDFAKQAGKQINGFTEASSQKLLQYDWPGNVRELRNVVERAVVLSRHPEIGIDVLPDKIVNHKSNQLVIDDQDNQPLASLDSIALRYIRYVLERTEGNKTEAARILGLDRKTLYRKLKEIE
jgi:two-component system response regulator HydG